ncbi:hypothetical protein DACRYDRAFT_14894 [Dacryopinax primogenitus]|uniref:Uncharacterized protein n=1 Tax=Dacryopinax primogenitus (strain DJM 731) TaxID=1858805 RepID=M5G5F8_DACPD|nr:uncharacterized protein DACRYDRAFT_14894 [Dacryopinax primogenitus]EJU03924.1 hypothetical protein DACRYDRAFT_14894 [Dacryopinax primogenitus]
MFEFDLITEAEAPNWSMMTLPNDAPASPTNMKKIQLDFSYNRKTVVTRMPLTAGPSKAETIRVLSEVNKKAPAKEGLKGKLTLFNYAVLRRAHELMEEFGHGMVEDNGVTGEKMEEEEYEHYDGIVHAEPAPDNGKQKVETVTLGYNLALWPSKAILEECHPQIDLPTARPITYADEQEHVEFVAKAYTCKMLTEKKVLQKVMAEEKLGVNQEAELKTLFWKTVKSETVKAKAEECRAEKTGQRHGGGYKGWEGVKQGGKVVTGWVGKNGPMIIKVGKAAGTIYNTVHTVTGGNLPSIPNM